MLPNDAIMVDKGFLIEKECALYNVKLIRPPFLKKNKQFSNAEAEKTASIAAARVHVERTIQRLKIFKILKGTIPHNMKSHADCIMIVIAGIVNITQPILAADKF